MIRNVMSCDICGADHKKTNGWTAVWVDSKRDFNSCRVDDLKQREVTINADGQQLIDACLVYHADTSECAVKMYNRWIATKMVISETKSREAT